MKLKKLSLTVVVPAGPQREMHVLKTLKQQRVPVKVVIEKGENPSRNRNRGAAQARTDLIAFVNTHSLLPSDWSEKVIAFFESHPDVDIAGGPQLTPPDQNFIGRASGYALSSVFGSAEASIRYAPSALMLNADEKHLTSANLICRKHVFTKVRFDEALYPGEDPKFIADAKKAGFNVAYDPGIFIYHKRRETLRDFALQVFNYGVMRPRKEPLRETLKHPSFLIPSFFVLYLPLFGILSLLNSFFMLPLMVYLILSIAFSLYESVRNHEQSAFWVLPFIFFIIHLMYGLGFLYGLITKNTKRP